MEYDDVEEKDGEDTGCKLMSYIESKLSETNEEVKKRRVHGSKYRSTEHVISTSNLCERLFSQSKIIMTDRRKSIQAKTLNEILFLKAKFVPVRSVGP